VQAPAPPASPELAPEPYPFLDLLVTLLVFLAIILAAWLAARWLMRRMYGPGAAGERIRVVERVPLEPRRTLFLVEAGDKLLLIGATDHDIRLLGEFARDALPPPTSPERRSFLDVLRAVTRGSGPGGAPPVS
jgi:flagellar biosynthetic protein FliO